VFLFQLLAVMGQWERALTQLKVAGEMDAATLGMVHMYRDAVACEAVRAEVFAGTRTPVVFGQPDDWIALLLQALKLTSEGHHAQAAEVRNRALDAAPATSGRIVTAADADAATAEKPARETAFAWISDADTRLGPMLETVVNGRYWWIPMHRIVEIQIESPEDLRDMVWTPAQFTWTNGGQCVGLIPTRYAGSETSDDPLVCLARKTDWLQPDEGVCLGLGQRTLATDVDDYPLLEIRQIQLNAQPEPPTEPSDA
jgi:type VI secretion system protein ImpE